MYDRSTYYEGTRPFRADVSPDGNERKLKSKVQYLRLYRHVSNFSRHPPAFCNVRTTTGRCEIYLFTSHGYQNNVACMRGVQMCGIRFLFA